MACRYVKRNPLKNDLEDITQCLECDTFSELKSHTEPKLNALLHEAIEYTCYYKKYKGYSSLSDFPVINKLVIKNNAEDFTIVKPKGDKLFKVSTSGSTGTPFSIYQTKRKKNKK